jgi:hypothetical protein
VIHVLLTFPENKDVDGRVKPGHDRRITIKPLHLACPRNISPLAKAVPTGQKNSGKREPRKRQRRAI